MATHITSEQTKREKPTYQNQQLPYIGCDGETPQSENDLQILQNPTPDAEKLLALVLEKVYVAVPGRNQTLFRRLFRHITAFEAL